MIGLLLKMNLPLGKKNTLKLQLQLQDVGVTRFQLTASNYSILSNTSYSQYKLLHHLIICLKVISKDLISIKIADKNFGKITSNKQAKKKKDVLMVESFGQCPNLRKTAPKLFDAPLQRFRNMMKRSIWIKVKRSKDYNLLICQL